MKCLHVFFSRQDEISSVFLRGCLHVKFHPWMKLSLSMVKCLLLFTSFCRNEISSRDELIPVKNRWNFIPEWKKEKKMCKHFIRGWNSEISAFFYFWSMYSNMLSKVNVFEHNENMNIMKHEASLSKVKSEKKRDEDNKWKIKNVKTFLFLLFSSGSLQKIEISFCFNLLP